ncbi:contractile injection system protein, VgrG/Pvc8 family [Pseudoalteromonas maricaloris]|uniref:contractile injection system protein, VgrG/Pvc8 family n=1 Tax=Pseudoalteromonas maricaloris TaxID=184924 RepID=UPI00351D2474
MKWRVTKDLPTLPQCVQALENDYTFFTRLLAKYGLIYWFECPSANFGQLGAAQLF